MNIRVAIDDNMAIIRCDAPSVAIGIGSNCAVGNGDFVGAGMDRGGIARRIGSDDRIIEDAASDVVNGVGIVARVVCLGYPNFTAIDRERAVSSVAINTH